MRAALASLLLGIGLSAPAPAARADDWLALLPDCSARTGSLPALELVYPEPDLPAVVDAGAGLVARVRVPAALTPPPGVQQERALSGWSAELIGGGVPLGADKLAHRYSVPVVAIRPDTGSSLLYRVRLAIAAYVAPGSYGLRLRTPFGDRESARSVAVIGAGTKPRIAVLQARPGGAPNTLPVDVWLTPSAGSEPEPGAAAAGREAFERELAAISARYRMPLQPVLALEGRAVALRVGSELWVTGGCESERSSFELEVTRLARAEGRRSVAIDAQHLPPSAASFHALEWSDLGSLRLNPGAHELILDNGSTTIERQLRVLVPANSSIAVSELRYALYPASDLDRRRLAATVLVLDVPKGKRARLVLGPAARIPAPRFDPEYAESGVPTIVRVKGAPPEARVAYEYGFARSALSGPELPVSFAGPLEEPLRALVLTPNAGAQWVQGELRVRARRPPSCSTGGPAGRQPATGLLFSLVFLLKRRPRREFGNTIRPALR